MRTANDIAAVAKNVAVYDSYEYNSYEGWFIAYGTSLATPILAGAFALAGDSTKQHAGKVFWTLSKAERKKSIHTITSGSISGCPPSLSGTYLCSAGTSQFGTYSGPTGWGTPERHRRVLVSAMRTDRTTVGRLAERAAYDFDTIAAIFDEAKICHVGFVAEDGRPIVLPTIHARIDRALYLHGSVLARWLKGAGGARLCVTATIVDDIVLARLRLPLFDELSLGGGDGHR